MVGGPALLLRDRRHIEAFQAWSSVCVWKLVTSGRTGVQQPVGSRPLRNQFAAHLMVPFVQAPFIPGRPTFPSCSRPSLSWVINLKTAKARVLDVRLLLVRVDEAIE
jgi:hypothetical protein